jgi:hypothetical protein
VREDLMERGVEFLTEALEFEEGASLAKFCAPQGQVYELWRPEERYTMGIQWRQLSIHPIAPRS